MRWGRKSESTDPFYDQCVRVMSLNHRMPTAAFSSQKSISSLFESVAILSEASQGRVTLLEALQRIGFQLRAEAAAMCRVDLSPENRSERAICHATKRSWTQDLGSFEVSFAAGVCGEDLASAQIGTVWRGTYEDFDTKERLATIFRSRRLSETIIIPLQKNKSWGDFLELHFCDPVSNSFIDYLELLGPVLAGCWKSRSPGLFACSALSHRPARHGSSGHRPILSVENPYRLSRAEYRVCLMLSRGLNNKTVVSELSVSMATLRTHLRNIYAKTDCASQPELVHKLLSSHQSWAVGSEGNARIA